MSCRVEAKEIKREVRKSETFLEVVEMVRCSRDGVVLFRVDQERKVMEYNRKSSRKRVRDRRTLTKATYVTYLCCEWIDG